MIEARIIDDIMRDGPGIALRDDNSRRFYNWHTGGWDDMDPAAMVDEQCILRLSSDAAHAVLEGLTRHYHGAEDTRALRKDYDAERARVDNFLDVILQGMRRTLP